MALALLVPLFFGGVVQIPTASAQDDGDNKISGLLRLQVEAKLRAREAGPLTEGQIDILQPMWAAGMELGDLNKQQIFIHLDQPLSQAQIAELESMGLTLYPDSWIPPLKNHPTGFIIGDMPLDKLSGLADKNYVVRLDTAERFLEPQNDLATQAINADDVWAQSYNGTGITIAVLDSGLDVTHADIPTPVASWDYAEDDATIANTYTGHGTHVTGSALGRASNTAGSTYNGTAPGADLVFLKIGSDATGSASTATIVYAIKGAIDTYSADVITMSYGNWDDYHDGTSEEAQAVDYAVNQGAVVFISAGNDANDDMHYSNTIAPSSSTDYIQVNIVVSGGGTGDYQTVLAYNLVWYDGGAGNDLELEYYDPSKTQLYSINGTQSHNERGTESQYSMYWGALPPGTYSCYLKVRNNSANSQFFHLYYHYNSIYNGQYAGTVKFNSLDADANYTISSPADADSAIAVGSYNTRQIWYNYANSGYWFPYDTTDNISTFSSRGPRVDTGATDKVDIVAPGSAIISARDNDVYTWAKRSS